MFPRSVSGRALSVDCFIWLCRQLPWRFFFGLFSKEIRMHTTWFLLYLHYNVHGRYWGITFPTETWTRGNPVLHKVGDHLDCSRSNHHHQLPGCLFHFCINQFCFFPYPFLYFDKYSKSFSFCLSVILTITIYGDKLKSFHHFFSQGLPLPPKPKERVSF